MRRHGSARGNCGSARMIDLATPRRDQGAPFRVEATMTSRQSEAGRRDLFFLPHLAGWSLFVLIIIR
uniref:Uncharacterized protein n=1 Tax=Arundo donax TaxID=35708 RepID=A0A0A9ECA4_ARUDO